MINRPLSFFAPVILTYVVAVVSMFLSESVRIIRDGRKWGLGSSEWLFYCLREGFILGNIAYGALVVSSSLDCHRNDSEAIIAAVLLVVISMGLYPLMERTNRWLRRAIIVIMIGLVCYSFYVQRVILYD